MKAKTVRVEVIEPDGYEIAGFGHKAQGEEFTLPAELAENLLQHAPTKLARAKSAIGRQAQGGTKKQEVNDGV